VTEVPVQIVVELAEMATVGVTLALTVIETELEVAVVGLAHAAVDVITQVTVFPLVNAPLV
jgi:hypothetical protein